MSQSCSRPRSMSQRCSSHHLMSQGCGSGPSMNPVHPRSQLPQALSPAVLHCSLLLSSPPYLRSSLSLPSLRLSLHSQLYSNALHSEVNNLALGSVPFCRLRLHLKRLPLSQPSPSSSHQALSLQTCQRLGLHPGKLFAVILSRLVLRLTMKDPGKILGLALRDLVLRTSMSSPGKIYRLRLGGMVPRFMMSNPGKYLSLHSAMPGGL